MAAFEKVYVQNLNYPLKIQYSPDVAFTKDNLSNTISVLLYTGEIPYSGGGTASASVVRADGVTVPLSGTVAANKISVSLTDSALDVPGTTQIYIKLTAGSVVTTVFAGVFSVVCSETDSIIEPATPVSVAALIASINAAIASIPADWSLMKAAIARDFDSSTAYGVGEYVWYNGRLYRFIATHAAGSWDANQVTPATLSNDVETVFNRMAVRYDSPQNLTAAQQGTARTNIAAASEADVTDLKSALNFDNLLLGTDWLPGFIAATGAYSAGGTDRICTRFIPCPPGITINYIAETNHPNICGIAFYNKYTTFISGEKNNADIGTEASVTSPANTAYMRLSTKVAIKNQTCAKYAGNNSSVLAWLQRQITNLTVYVDKTIGDDTTGAGTSGSPYKTIAKAISTGAKNICISPGIYTEPVSASFLEYLRLFPNYVSFNSTSITDKPKVIIDGNGEIDTPLSLSYIRELYLDDIVVQNSASGKKGCVIDHCQHIELHNCEFLNNGHDGCVINYSNGIIRDCKANGNGNDGFNMNYFGDTQFINCSGHDNVDDGISHHQGCTGYIEGGEWYGNGKGGVASPAHGSQVDIANVYCHDNAYGIYANADSDTVARTFHDWNSVLVNNSQYGITSKRNTAIMYNCKIAGNTAGQTTAPQGGSIIVL